MNDFWRSILSEVLDQQSPKPHISVGLKDGEADSSVFTHFTHAAKSVEQNRANRPPKTGLTKGKRYSLGPNYPNVYFTKREAQIVFCFLKGMTSAKAADVLDLSLRTVEFYAGNIKKKLHCRLKSVLLRKVQESDFLAHVDFAEELLQACE